MSTAPIFRRFRFSLRFLLFVMFLIAIASGLIGRRLHEANLQHDAVLAIIQHGGYCNYDYQREFYQSDSFSSKLPVPSGPAWLRQWLSDDFFNDVVDVELWNRDDIKLLTNFDRLQTLAIVHVEDAQDSDLRVLEGLSKLEELTFNGNINLTGAGLKYISNSKSLKLLEITRKMVSDQSLANLRNLQNLEHLTISNASFFEGHKGITDSGMVHLEGLTNLKTLKFLFNPHITDQGLLHLRSLTKLEKLTFLNSRISDKGLIEICKMTRLIDLSLIATDITEDGLVHLQSLPNLKRLCLSNTLLTDTGLKNLVELEHLEYLQVSGDKTEDDLAKIQRTLPNVKIP